MQEERLDCYLTMNVRDIYYLTGFQDIPGASLSLIVPARDEVTLLTRPLSFDAATAQATDCTVKGLALGENLSDGLVQELKSSTQKRLGYDDLPLQIYLRLATSLQGVELVPTSLVINQRRVKDTDEVALIRRACKLADAGVEAALEAIRAGTREYEVAAQAEYAMRRSGSSGFAFETLVASGPRSAYPHGVCSDREIKQGDLVIVDLGAVWKGYCSDITRTVTVGSPSLKNKRLLELIQEAHDKVLNEIRPGVEAADVDAVARKVVGEDCARYFIHGLGHGIGLDIHEAPTLSQTSRDVLEAGNVVTDEPGMYFPGYGGVRIEDTILITSKGAEKLTGASYPTFPQ